MYPELSTLPVSAVTPDARALFIRRVYGHLAAAVFCFIVLETILLHSPIAHAMIQLLARTQYSWLLILGGFALASWIARTFASRMDSQPLQYFGLGIYILAEAFIFLPIIIIAMFYSDPMVLPSAAILTTALFMGLTVVAFTTKTDFSFLGSILSVGGMVALGLIVCAVIFGFQLGLLFSGAMILLASGAILYDTQKILKNYPTGAYVAASLQLFASVMLLFWYIMRILMRRR